MKECHHPEKSGAFCCCLHPHNHHHHHHRLLHLHSQQNYQPENRSIYYKKQRHFKLFFGL